MKLCVYGWGMDEAMVFMGGEGMELCIYGRGRDEAMYLWEGKGWS